MQTRKLYYENAYTRQFAARVLSCKKTDGSWAVALDATAFFPEEGGQSADTGTLGNAKVLDVRERGGAVTHLTNAPLPVGETVEGTLDWDARFRKMQDHSGEHIVSGLIHARFGYDNVGFHLGADGMTIDFNGELTRRQLDEIEDAANAVVWADKPVAACFPSAEELKALDYRSKLELTENVRLVTIPGVDACACCAPHVSSTGQIGVIKLLDFMRHRGGVRVWARCGSDALADYRARYASTAAVSALLSAPQTDIDAAAERLLAEQESLRQELSALKREILNAQIASLASTDGNLCLFADTDEDGLRALVNAGMPLCGGICAAFSGSDGAYRFVLGSRTQDTHAVIEKMKLPLQARGGGKPGMVMGSCAAGRAQIAAFFQN